MYLIPSGDLILTSYDTDFTNPTTGSNSSNSNIAEDQPAPNSQLDLDDLSRGSAGVLDPYIGPVELPITPAGQYSVAVSSTNRSPAELQQFRQANAQNSLARLEPVNSVTRIAEDHIGTSGGSTSAAPITTTILDVTFDTTSNNSQAATPFFLGDVVLFATSGTEIQTFNPFTGASLADLTNATLTRHEDIVLRPDGELFGLSNPNNVTKNDGNMGNYLNFDTGTAAITVAGDDQIQTWADDPMNVPNDARQDVGIPFNAMAFQTSGTTVRLYAIGERGNGVNVGSPGLTPPFDVLFHLSADNGSVIGNGLDRGQNGAQDRNQGAGTLQREQGILRDAADVAVTGFRGSAFIGNQMYGVTNSGDLYEINHNSAVVTLVANVGGLGINFQGLTRGPQNAEDGKYANMLFGVANNGTLYAFDTTGALQPAFVNGQTSVSLGAGYNSVGIAFSNLDHNLWHVTNTRRDDLGHGIETSFDGNRTTRTIGGQSLWFGWEDSIDNGNNRLIASGTQPGACGVDDANLQWRTNNNTVIPTTICSNYDFPGGAHGSLESNVFSLRGYSPEDAPTLYFDYHLNTENANAFLDSDPRMRDSFRVFAAGSDGVWRLLATNNSLRNSSRTDEYEQNGGGTNVQELFDIGDSGANDSCAPSQSLTCSIRGSRESAVAIRFQHVREHDEWKRCRDELDRHGAASDRGQSTS